MTEPIDPQEIAACSCLRARRAARHLSRIYDNVLEPSGITANQVGLLAKLLGAHIRGQESLPIGAIHAWNLVVGFVFLVAGVVLSTKWH